MLPKQITYQLSAKWLGEPFHLQFPTGMKTLTHYRFLAAFYKYPVEVLAAFDRESGTHLHQVIIHQVFWWH